MAVFSKLTLASLPLELFERIEDFLDLSSLLALGQTCQDVSAVVSGTLQRDRDRIIRRYYDTVETLLFRLTWCRAVITGEAALAFIARDLSLLTNELEICVPCGYSEEMLQDFDRDAIYERAWPDHVWPRLDYHRTTEFVYKHRDGTRIRLICSHTDSPFSPMATYPTTALFNYIDEYSFGSAYRDLTLNQRALVPAIGDLSMESQTRVLRITNQGGFDQSPCAAAVAFPPVPWTAINTLADLDDPNQEEFTNTACLRHMDQCPGQARFFGDRGSLVEFFAPDMVDQAVMAHCALPPYGPTAVWRMDGSYCDYHCETGDYVLSENLSAVCVIGCRLYYGPFTKCVAGRIVIGESQHRRVWNAGLDAIRLPRRGAYWGTPSHPAYMP